MPDRSYREWPFLDDEHRALARALDAWAAANVADLPEVGEEGVDDRCRELVRALADGGWLRYAAPTDVRSLCLIRETLAYHDALADFAFAMQGLGSGAIALFGTEELRDRYLPGVADGERIAAFALSEPEAGSDVAALATTATADGEDYVLNGTKTWISNGGIAHFYVVFAKAEEGISAFVVDAKEVDASERIDIVAPHPMAVVKLKNSKGTLLGEAGQGFKLAMRNLDIFRTTVAGAALGFARRALDESLKRTKTRKMFGHTLADFQMSQAKLADMATSIDAAALLTYRSAWTKDVQAKRVTREAAMAKMFATEAAQAVIDNAVQLLGGLGVMRGHPVERLYREVRALRIYEGATEVQKLIIAKDLLKG
jgi:acyl-CoA dehydrogenase